MPQAPELPNFSKAPFPGFLLEKYLMEFRGPDRPFVLLELQRHAKATLDLGLARALKDYRDLSRKFGVKF